MANRDQHPPVTIRTNPAKRMVTFELRVPSKGLPPDFKYPERVGATLTLAESIALREDLDRVISQIEETTQHDG